MVGLLPHDFLRVAGYNSMGVMASQVGEAYVLVHPCGSGRVPVLEERALWKMR